MKQRGSFQKTFLHCQNNGLGKGDGEIIYKYGEIEINTSKKAKNKEIPMITKVSIDKCVNKDHGKKQECELKVVTGNKLDWSKKVNARATLILGK